MENNIYCYYLDNYDRVSEFLVSYESLKATNPQYPVYCLLGRTIWDTNDSKLIDFLSSIGVISLRSNKQLCEISYTDNEIADIWWGCGTLELFRFQQFDKIVILDTDMWIKSNIDEIFNYENGSMAPHSNVETGSNGGTMVIKPNSEFNEYFLKERDEGYANHHFNFTFDQDFVAHYANWDETPNLHLPLTYNYIVFNSQDITEVSMKDAKILHFGTIGRKVENLSSYQIIAICQNNLQQISCVSEYLDFFDEVINKYKEKEPQIPLYNSMVYADRIKNGG